MTSIELQTRVRDALTEALSVPVVKYVQEYKGRNSRPFVVYQEISNAPALHADGREMGFRSTFQISIGTADDEYGELEAKVEAAMTSLGFMRKDAHDIHDDIYFRVIRFVIVCGK
jgi:hypothetical protein